MNTNTLYANTIKPIGDFIGALCLATLLIIPFLIIWLVLFISGTKSPIFKQDRPGKNEKIFYILKFKTMTDEKDSNGVLLSDEKRTTKLGNFLRKTSLDEIPQIINILNGDMSFVGPRPLRTRYLPYYTKEELARHIVKPGITGLAQVSGRNAINWDEKLKYDIDYLKNMTLLTDIKILFKTFIKIFNSSEINLNLENSSFDEYRQNKLNTSYKK
ncbi:sugar transferase [uncultured Algibacter sp.]|uniref:sugar transferase n=1 Tax=uncultured Algibacter sp. TaxID=298659 RepID=UPI00262CBFA8|nr:sugar transferase [uncultured Algibacter sp.]